MLKGCLVFFLIVILDVTPCHAHKVKMFASAENNVITGYVYYTTGGQPKHATVLVQNSMGKTLAEVTTNEKGEFSFIAENRQDYIFVLELADGHRATFRLTADELPESLPAAATGHIAPPDQTQHTQQDGKAIPSIDNTLFPQNSLDSQISLEELEKIVGKAVNKQIRPLREQLEHYEEKIRLHDILGGVGYIIGLMGLGYFIAARRKHPESSS